MPRTGARDQAAKGRAMTCFAKNHQEKAENPLTGAPLTDIL